MGLKAAPACRIEVGGRDVTAAFSDRLLRIVVTDNSGDDSDEVEIELDDRDYAIEEPRRGASLTVYLGYKDAPLVLLGKFVVDEALPEGPPDRFIIRGKAADMRGGLKAPRTRSWRDTTVGAIVSQIASDQGLQPAVASGLASRPIVHRDQTNESDMHFLTRLGRDFGAVAAPKNGRLVFAPAGAATAASGTPLTGVTLKRSDLIDWKGVAADREDFGSVKARWRDRAQARTLYETAGEGEPVKTLRHRYPTQAAAKAAADAEFARLNRVSGGVEITLPGRADIAAQTPITLTGLRPSLNKQWIATRVEHQVEFGGSGFTTRVEANQTGKVKT